MLGQYKWRNKSIITNRQSAHTHKNQSVIHPDLCIPLLRYLYILIHILNVYFYLHAPYSHTLLLALPNIFLLTCPHISWYAHFYCILTPVYECVWVCTKDKGVKCLSHSHTLIHTHLLSHTLTHTHSHTHLHFHFYSHTHTYIINRPVFSILVLFVLFLCE